MIQRQQIWFLRAEGLIILLVALAAYENQSLSWWWFGFGLLLPDVSMAGYLAGNKLGAYVYNAGHSLIVPLILVWAGLSFAPKGILALGLIWVVHIGMDRTFGYGLKSTKGFNHTHLGMIGRK